MVDSGENKEIERDFNELSGETGQIFPWHELTSAPFFWESTSRGNFENILYNAHSTCWD